MKKEIVKIDLEKKYNREIKGFGEIYEIMSVRNTQRKLRKKFGKGILFLVSNKSHKGRGLTLSEIQKLLQKKNYQILKSGFTDSFLISSNPRKKEDINPFVKSFLLVFLTQFFFWIVVQFEFLWESSKSSHMIYTLTKEKRR
ncbi:MAG: hypothetical protein GTN40_05755 [Candidatus Aenigmarchaeota archaeon]|nr:hypothetical protein [Candidatus Aenigmarchaeota archaeon]